MPRRQARRRRASTRPRPAAGSRCRRTACASRLRSRHAEFKWPKAAPSILLVAFGGFASLWICIGIFSRERFFLKGLTTRFAPARWGYNFLVNKYYLDHLYEKVIVHGIAHPIAQGRVLDQPARARRHRQRHRQVRPALR